MDHRHQRRDDAPRIVVLVDVAAIDQAQRALRQQRRGLVEDGAQILLAAAAHQHRHARRLDDAVEVVRVAGRVGLDDVGAHLGGEAHQRHDLLGVAVDLVAAADVVRAA